MKQCLIIKKTLAIAGESENVSVHDCINHVPTAWAVWDNPPPVATCHRNVYCFAGQLQLTGVGPTATWSICWASFLWPHLAFFLSRPVGKCDVMGLALVPEMRCLGV